MSMETGKHEDPITSDPIVVDWDFPPTSATVILDSHGAHLNGILYISQGAGPHPTVILLHGYPGDERHLDLAHAIRRTGWNVLFFHYRGAWGSPGLFSIIHALEDVAAAVEFLGRPESQQNYRVDASRIALVGHSMGAYLALIAGSRLPSIRHIAALTPVNLGYMGYRSNPEALAAIAEGFDAMGHGAIRGADRVEGYAAMAANPSRYDLPECVPQLDGKSLLLVAAARDEDVPMGGHYEPLVRRLKERNQAHLTTAILDTDHVFSNARIALARLVTQWLADTA